MISVWRIAKKKHGMEVFDGEGASKYGGRWNHRGTKIVYTSDSLALAALEILVHLESYDTKYEQQSFEIIIPANTKIETLDLKKLEHNSCEDIGSQWVADGKTVLLKVPSAIIPSEYNYLINPNHPDFTSLKIKTPTIFYFDNRLLKIKKAQSYSEIITKIEKK